MAIISLPLHYVLLFNQFHYLLAVGQFDIDPSDTFFSIPPGEGELSKDIFWAGLFVGEHDPILGRGYYYEGIQPGIGKPKRGR